MLIGLRVMKLPEVFDARASCGRSRTCPFVPPFLAPLFMMATARVDRVHERRAAGEVSPMTRRVVHVKRPEQVARTHQFLLLFQTRSERSSSRKLPYLMTAPSVYGILRRRVLDARHEFAAQRIGRAAPGIPASGVVINSPADGHDRHIEPGHRDLRAGLRHRHVAPFLAHRGVGVECGATVRLPFHRPPAVIPEMANRKTPRELRGVADVIAVVVRHDDVVELLLDRHLLDDVGDAIGVAVVVAAGPGVEQQRLARRCHEERRLSALGVDEIDVERRRRLPLGEDQLRRERTRDEEEGGSAHGESVIGFGSP